MKTTIQAVYERGLLRPIDKINLPENRLLSLTVEISDASGFPVSRPLRIAGKELLDLPGLFPRDDLKEIEEALRECRQVEADGW